MRTHLATPAIHHALDGRPDIETMESGRRGIEATNGFRYGQRTTASGPTAAVVKSALWTTRLSTEGLIRGCWSGSCWEAREAPRCEWNAFDFVVIPFHISHPRNHQIEGLQRCGPFLFVRLTKLCLAFSSPTESVAPCLDWHALINDLWVSEYSAIEGNRRNKPRVVTLGM